MNASDIFFKAKRVDNGKWIEGYFAQKRDTTYCFSDENKDVKTRSYIIVDAMTDWGLPNEFNCFEVNPETVCQYIGEDKNGERIYDNDILNNGTNYFKINYVATLHCYTITIFSNIYKTIMGQYCEYEDCAIEFNYIYCSNSTVVGNIFDDNITDKIKESLGIY